VQAEWPAPGWWRCHQESADRQSTQARPKEISLKAFEGCFAPGEQRTDSGKQQKEKRNRNADFVKERRPDRNLVSLDPFGEYGKQSSPQHRETGQQQKEIVEQKAGLA